MRCQFQDGEYFTIKKVPFENIIEAKVSGKILRYERAKDGLKRLTDESDHREEVIKARITQYYVQGPRYSRQRRSFSN